MKKQRTWDEILKKPLRTWSITFDHLMTDKESGDLWNRILKTLKKI